MSTQLVRWLAEVTLSPARTDGVHGGTFTDSGELCAVVGGPRRPHGVRARPGSGCEGGRTFGHDVGFMERYRQSQNPMWAPGRCPGASVSVATVAPNIAAAGVLRAAVEPVIAEACGAMCPVLRTGTRRSADAYVGCSPRSNYGNI